MSLALVGTILAGFSLLFSMYTVLSARSEKLKKENDKLKLKELDTSIKTLDGGLVESLKGQVDIIHELNGPGGIYVRLALVEEKCKKN